MTLHGQLINVGDRVWSIQYGWDVVIEIDVASDYPINIPGNMYTWEGQNYKEDVYPSLFWQELPIPPKVFIKPLHQLEVDTKVLVWDNEDISKYKRYFSHFDSNGEICCFNNGATSWETKEDATTYWSHWELYKEELQ
jgi:hypothetical protein